FGGPIANVVKGGVQRGAETVAGMIPDAYRPSWLDSAANVGAEKAMTGARNTVAKSIGQTLSDPEIAANVQESKGLQQEIPGFNPGFARSTGDKSVMNLQQNFDQAATGPELRQSQKGFDESSQAIRDYLERGVPPSEGFPADTVAETVGNRAKTES